MPRPVPKFPASHRPKQTGPRTPLGKARSKMNAARHGLRAAATVLPGEDPAEYEQYVADVVESLNPAGTLEEELARRAAAGLWRLRRTERWEAARARLAAQADPDQVNAQLAAADAEIARLRAEQAAGQRDPAADPPLLVRLPTLSDAARVDALEVAEVFEGWADRLPDPSAAPGLGEVCERLGLSESAVKEPLAWAGWDAGLVRRLLAEYVPALGLTVDQYIAEAEADWRAGLPDERARRRQARARLKAEIRALELRKADLVADRAAPEALRLDLLGRYEASALRVVDKSLKNLRASQAGRRCRPRPVDPGDAD